MSSQRWRALVLLQRGQVHSPQQSVTPVSGVGCLPSSGPHTYRACVGTLANIHMHRSKLFWKKNWRSSFLLLEGPLMPRSVKQVWSGSGVLDSVAGPVCSCCTECCEVHGEPLVLVTFMDGHIHFRSFPSLNTRTHYWPQRALGLG